MKPRAFVCVFLALTLVTACVPSMSVSIKVPEPDYWPTSGWKSSSPEAQGMDSELLSQMLEDVSTSETRIHSILIIRNGYMVTEAYFHPYTQDTKMHIQSVTKSVIGALVGIAVKEGYIQSQNETMLSFFPDQAYANSSPNKDAIRLEHLLSMSSGLGCAEFSGSGPSMEQSRDWVQFALDVPAETPPGQTFTYCNANVHLLSAILEKATGMNTREFANKKLFKPLGIPTVDESDWGVDPQKITLGGYGLFLRPVDMAKIAFLYLHNGKWDGQRILPPKWVAESTTQHIQKPEGSGYGYLWTVYPETGHYAALGLAGQQIHVYPSKNLIVIVTAELKSYAEAPEIERVLNRFILPAIKSDVPLAENSAGVARLRAAVDFALNPIRPVPDLPAIAQEISGKLYTLEENVNGWRTMVLFFEPGASIAHIGTEGFQNLDEIGLDNIYRSGKPPTDQYLMRGRWVDNQTFVFEWMPLPLGNNGTYEIKMKYRGDDLEITIESLISGEEPVIIKGIK